MVMSAAARRGMGAPSKPKKAPDTLTGLRRQLKAQEQLNERMQSNTRAAIIKLGKDCDLDTTYVNDMLDDLGLEPDVNKIEGDITVTFHAVLDDADGPANGPFNIGDLHSAIRSFIEDAEPEADGYGRISISRLSVVAKPMK